MNWTLLSTQNLHADAYHNFIHNCQSMEATKMPLRRSMDILWFIQTAAYYPALRRNELSNHEETWRKHPITKWNKPIWKVHILYNSNYMKFYERWNYEDSKKISSCPGLGLRVGLEGWIDKAQRIYRAVQNTLSMLQYNDEFTSLCICPNPVNVHHQEDP